MNIKQGQKARIFMRKVGKGKKAFMSYSLTVSRKDEDENWINANVFAYLSNAARDHMKELAKGGNLNKEDGYQWVDISLDDAWLSAREAEPYNQLTLFINEFSLYDEEAAKGKGNKDSKNDNDGEVIDDTEDVPF